MSSDPKLRERTEAEVRRKGEEDREGEGRYFLLLLLLLKSMGNE